MTEVVLDASAILAFLRKEPGSDNVRPFLRGGQLSTVNLAEVLAKGLDAGIEVAVTEGLIAELGVECVPFDDHQAAASASIRPVTVKYGLSLADRACLALAMVARLPVLTADRRWKDAGLNLDVRLIRP